MDIIEQTILQRIVQHLYCSVGTNWMLRGSFKYYLQSWKKQANTVDFQLVSSAYTSPSNKNRKEELCDQMVTIRMEKVEYAINDMILIYACREIDTRKSG